MATNWLRPRGTLTRDDERRFPNLALAITLPGRWYLKYFQTMQFAWMAALAIAFGSSNWRSAPILWIVGAGLVFACIPSAVIAIACGYRGRGSHGRLKERGYSRFGEKLVAGEAAMILDPALIRRVPHFSEIEPTPYNSESDPNALLRMLDDLAEQMEWAAKPASATRKIADHPAPARPLGD